MTPKSPEAPKGPSEVFKGQLYEFIDEKDF